VRKGFKQLSIAISLLLVLLLLIPLTNSIVSANSNADPRILEEIQRAYDEMGITALWNMGFTGSGMKIAIIDDGVDYTNPDLGGCFGPNCKVTAGWDVDNNDPDPMPVEPSTSHGTLLAGEMVANSSMKGIAYGAKLLAYKADGTGGPDVGFRALERLLQDGGADYLNFSSGFTVQGKEDNFTKEFTDPYYRSLYEQAEKQGMLIFRSAGNFGSALLETVEHPFPAFHPMYYFSPVGNRVSEPTMLNIGAYQWDREEISELTSMGPSLNGEIQPELLAPVGYPITYMPNVYQRTGGTSCAAPFAGAVATLVKQAHKDWRPEDIRAALMNTASVLYNKVTGEPVTALIQGSGLINPVAAVKTPALITPYVINMTADKFHPVELTIKNVTNETQTFNVSVELTLGNYEYGQNQGLSLSLSTSKLTVNPGSTATLGLTGNVDFSKLTKGPHEAIIWFKNGTVTLHVPIMIWNDLNSIWWSRTPDQYIGANKYLPPKLINVRATKIPSSNNVAIDFTLNRGSIVGYTWGTAEPTFGNYADRIRVDIVNQSGATVATVFDEGHLLIGHYRAVWDGKDSNGQPVLAGDYKYVISALDYFTRFDIPIIDTDAQFTGYITVGDDTSLTPSLIATASSFSYIPGNPKTPTVTPPATPINVDPNAPPILVLSVKRGEPIIITVPASEIGKPIKYTFTGTTDPGNTLEIEYFYFPKKDIRESTQTPVAVNPDGSFTYTVELKSNTNYFTFYVVKPLPDGNARTLSQNETVFIEYETPAPAPAPTPTPQPVPVPQPQPEPITPTTQPTPLSVIELQIGNPVFKLNNQALLLDSPPVIKNNRTLLPIRAVVEAMGGVVEWSDKDKRVGIEYRDKNITLWIGKNIALVNGKGVIIDPQNLNVVPEIINGRTMLPLRFVAESLGCQVEWDDKTKTITILYPSY